MPSTLMIFAVRVVLFGRGVQHHGEQAAVVILGPGRIDRGAYRQEKGEVWFRREAVDARACPYPGGSSMQVHNPHGRTIGIIEATNDDLIGNRCRRLRKPARAQAPAATRCCGYPSPGLPRPNHRIPDKRLRSRNAPASSECACRLDGDRHSLSVEVDEMICTIAGDNRAGNSAKSISCTVELKRPLPS